MKTVSISDKKEVTGAHGVPVVADLLLSDVEEEEAEFLICPGGMPGAKNLGDCTALVQMIQKHFDKGGYVAAICAAPALVLSKIKMNKRYIFIGIVSMMMGNVYKEICQGENWILKVSESLIVVKL